MAQPEHFNGAQILIKVGDGADPEVFTHPCLINSTRAVQINTSVNEFVIPDCANPEDPAWLELEKDSTSVTVTGEGISDGASLLSYTQWAVGKDTKNLEVVIGANVTNGIKLTGAFMLTEFQPGGGDRKEKSTSSLTLRSSGPVTVAANS